MRARAVASRHYRDAVPGSDAKRRPSERPLFIFGLNADFEIDLKFKCAFFYLFAKSCAKRRRFWDFYLLNFPHALSQLTCSAGDQRVMGPKSSTCLMTVASVDGGRMVEITGTPVDPPMPAVLRSRRQAANGADSPVCTGCIGGMTVAMLCSGNARPRGR